MRKITFPKFTSEIEFHETFRTEKACIAFLEKELWPNGPVSPYDKTSKVYRRSDGTYRCKNTGKNFNVKVGTIFENTKLSLRIWFTAIYHMCNETKGISSMQLMKNLHVTKKTAWFLSHRIRECYDIPLEEKFDGEVEIDETFVGGKNKNRHWNKKTKNVQNRLFRDKVPVMGLMQRSSDKSASKVYCKALNGVSWRDLTPVVFRNVKTSATIYSDEWKGYKYIHKVYESHVVDHGHGKYVDGDAYTNTIEGFWGNYCKRPIVGLFNFLSRKHIQRYFNEFAFRHNNRKVSNYERFDMAILNCCHRLTYKDLVNGNKKAA